MHGLFDCYVLAPERTAAMARGFLSAFLPHAEPSFAPADPSETLGVSPRLPIDGVLTHLEQDTEATYAMYFRSLVETGPRHAGLMFTPDGHLILMLSVDASRGAEHAGRSLAQMTSFTGASVGYFGFEEPPPPDAQQFMERSRGVR